MYVFVYKGETYAKISYIKGNWGGGQSETLSDQCFKPAFTLAEVLITLGTIGIVAAMTLPALITKKQTKELEVGLKKGYATVSTVLQMMAYEEGKVNSYSNYGYDEFAPVFDKYLVSAKACPDEGSCFLVVRGEDTDESGTNVGFDFADYKTYNKKAKVSGDYMDDGQFLLRNGMAIYIENNLNRIFISIDVNGMYKKPNLWGHDLFTFQLLDNGKLLPMGADGTSFDEDDYCSTTSSSKQNGIACTNKALNDADYWKNLP